MRKRFLFDLLFVIFANAVGWGMLTYFDYLQEAGALYRAESYMRLWCYAAPILMFLVYFIMSKNYRAAHPFGRAALFMTIWVGAGVSVGEAIIYFVKNNEWVIYQKVRAFRGAEYGNFLPRFVGIFAAIFIVVSSVRMTYKHFRSVQNEKSKLANARKGVGQF